MNFCLRLYSYSAQQKCRLCPFWSRKTLIFPFGFVELQTVFAILYFIYLAPTPPFSVMLDLNCSTDKAKRTFTKHFDARLTVDELQSLIDCSFQHALSFYAKIFAICILHFLLVTLSHIRKCYPDIEHIFLYTLSCFHFCLSVELGL